LIFSLLSCWQSSFPRLPVSPACCAPRGVRPGGGKSLRGSVAAAVAAFGAEVDDPVGGLDDVEIVLDHHDRVALVDQFMQHFQQLATSSKCRPVVGSSRM
jgi:hypothetical protein